MLKKIGCTLLCVGALVSGSILAQADQLTAGPQISYDFEPNKAQVLENNFFWVINGQCLVKTADASNDISATLLAKKGKVNGTVLNKGDSIVITVHNGDSFMLSADPGARVEIVNRGNSVVHADCTSA